MKGLFKVSGSRPCNAAGSLVSPTAAPSISVLQVMTAAFKNHTRQIGKATLATGAAAQELGVHVAVVAVLFKVLSCLGVKRTSGSGGGGFFTGGVRCF